MSNHLWQTIGCATDSPHSTAPGMWHCTHLLGQIQSDLLASNSHLNSRARALNTCTPSEHTHTRQVLCKQFTSILQPLSKNPHSDNLGIKWWSGTTHMLLTLWPGERLQLFIKLLTTINQTRTSSWDTFYAHPEISSTRRSDTVNKKLPTNLSINDKPSNKPHFNFTLQWQTHTHRYIHLTFPLTLPRDNVWNGVSLSGDTAINIFFSAFQNMLWLLVSLALASCAACIHETRKGNRKIMVTFARAQALKTP